MPLNITIEGRGVIANADAFADSAGGSWNEDGSGTDSFTTFTYQMGGVSFAGAYSNKDGYQYFDIGAGNELNFDVAGAEEGQHIIIPVMSQVLGVIEVKAYPGMAIRIGTDLSNYREYVIAGQDDQNGWDGSWKPFMLDPTKPGTSADVGTFNIASVRYIGIFISCSALVAGDVIFIDQLLCGKGLRITGDSTTAWQDVLDWCTDYFNVTTPRAWNFVRNLDGVISALGKFYIGSSTQTAITSFKDSAKSIKFTTSEYWNGTAWVSTMDVDSQGLVFEDAAGYATNYEDGIIVGTDNGRSGTAIQGNPTHNASIDMSGLTNAASTVKCYASQFKGLLGTFTYHNNVNSLLFGATIDGCAQFDPVGSAVIRRLILSGYTLNTAAALLWNENIDIKDAQFIANTDLTNDPAAIEHPSAVGNPYLYDNLTFSGNDFDINNTSGSAIFIDPVNGTNVDGTDPDKGSAVTINEVPVILTIKGWVSGGTLVIYDDDSVDPQELGTELQRNDNIIVDETYAYTSGKAGDDIVIVFIKNGYKLYQETVTLGANSADKTINPEQETN